MFRTVILALLLFVFTASPSFAKSTSDPNHKGYTKKIVQTLDFQTKEKIKSAEFKTIDWKDRKTKCKPCQSLLEQYNATVQNLFKARTQVAKLDFNTTREGISDLKVRMRRFYNSATAEAIKLASVMDFVDVSEQNLPKAKQLVKNLEILASELRGRIQDCEKQCKGKEQDIIIKDPKALVLPYDWAGPYVTACPQKCQKLADYLNGYPAKTYPLLAKKRFLELKADEAKLELKLMRLSPFSAGPDGDEKTAELENTLKSHQNALKAQQRKIDKIKHGFKMDLKAFKKCEKQCKPAKEPKKHGCKFPTNRPEITIGPNNKFGHKADFNKKTKSKAKGMAMGGLMGKSGGFGFGGGGGRVGPPMKGGGQKGPKKDKDPTSGKFTKVSDGGVGLKTRAQFTDEGLVVSTEIDKAPGNGTFHAQWLEDGKGKIYLPKRYLLIDLYRKWKLSVWWSFKRWVNGDLVEHRTGDYMEVGSDYLGTLALYEGPKGVAKSIWHSMGFETALKGVKHLGAVYDVPPSALEGPCPLQLVTHISKPKADPVTTQPVVVNIEKPDVSALAPEKRSKGWQKFLPARVSE